MQDEQGLTEEAAAWAVDSWRMALGLPGIEPAQPEPLPDSRQVVQPRPQP